MSYTKIAPLLSEIVQLRYQFALRFFIDYYLSAPTIDFSQKSISDQIVKICKVTFKDNFNVNDIMTVNSTPSLREIKSYLEQRLTMKAPCIVLESNLIYLVQQAIDYVCILTDQNETLKNEIFDCLNKTYHQIFYLGSARNYVVFDQIWEKIRRGEDFALCNFLRKLGSSDKWRFHYDDIPEKLRVFQTKSITMLFSDANLTQQQQIICLRLITSLIYHGKRYPLTDPQCQILLDQLEQYIPYIKSRKDIKEFEEFVYTQEQVQHTYFGENLSDNSDSDEEVFFQQQPDLLKRLKKTVASKFIEISQPNSLFQNGRQGRKEANLRTNRPAPSSIFDLPQRQTITHPAGVITEQDRARLQTINNAIKNGMSLEKLSVETSRFCVAQYRGITYLTSKWSQSARRLHRAKDEIGHAQYSASVWHESGSCPFNTRNYPSDAITAKNLEIIAIDLKKKLVSMRQATGFEIDNFIAPNLAIGLQLLYSKNYDKFHELIRSQDTELKPYILNGENPFLSTGDVPYHALRYAYGIKPYEGHEHVRLRPRWRRDGQAERPYSGKIYCSLHPLTDFGQDGPYHNVTLLWQAAMNLDNLIAAERESAFLAKIDAHRVCHQHIAKYPSFKNYKDIYLEKYGLEADVYQAFKNIFDRYPPHSEIRKNVILLLGEWLCAYHEVQMIEIMRLEAESQGKLLIYRDKDGGFSFDLPIYTPMQNGIPEEQSTPIKKIRARSSLSPSDGNLIGKLSIAEALARSKAKGTEDDKELILHFKKMGLEEKLE